MCLCFCCLECKNEKKVNFVHAERSGTSNWQREKGGRVNASCRSLEATCFFLQLFGTSLKATSAVLCCFESKSVQVVKFATWRMFLRTFLLFLSFLRQPHVMKKQLWSGGNMREHDDVILIPLKFQQNVLKNVLLVPCTFEAKRVVLCSCNLVAYLRGHDEVTLFHS